MTLSENIDYQIWLIMRAIADARLVAPSNWITHEFFYGDIKLFDPHLSIETADILKHETHLTQKRVYTLLSKIEHEGYIKQVHSLTNSVPDYTTIRVLPTASFDAKFKGLDNAFSKIDSTEPKLRFDATHGVLHKDGVTRTAPFKRNSNMFLLLEKAFEFDPLDEIEAWHIRKFDSETLTYTARNINTRVKKEFGIDNLFSIDYAANTVQRTQ